LKEIVVVFVKAPGAEHKVEGVPDMRLVVAKRKGGELL